MAIPSENDLLAELNTLASYEELKKEGSFSRLLPLVAMLRKDGGLTSSQVSFGASAIKQDEQSNLLQAIFNKFPVEALSSDETLLLLRDQLVTIASLLPNELSTEGRFKVQLDVSQLPVDATRETTLVELRDKLSLLLNLLPLELSSAGRFKVESSIRCLNIKDDKVGATIESSVLPTNAASNTSLLEVSQKLSDLINLLPTTLSTEGKFKVDVNASVLATDASTETTLAKLPIQLGSINETPAIDETVASGLNGLIRLLITRFTSLLPVSLSNGRFKVEQRDLTIAQDKVGVAVESTVLAPNAASDSSLVTLSNQLGLVTEVAPSSPTGASGLNGLFRFLLSKLPTSLSTEGRFKVETNTRNLTVAQDKVGVTVESSVLPSNAATDASLIAIYNRLYKAPWSLYNHSNLATVCIKPSLGFLHSFYCTNLSATNTYFLQFFNKTTVAVAGDVPVQVAFELLAGDTIAIGDSLLGERGVGFDTGLTYGFSSQRDTFQPITIPTDLRVTFYYE